MITSDEICVYMLLNIDGGDGLLLVTHSVIFTCN